MAVQERLYTAEDLIKLSNGSKRYELLEGHLIEMSPTGTPHGLVTNWLAYLLTSLVTEHKLGFVFAAESGFRLSNDPDTVLGVDIAFVTIARIQKDEGFFRGAPDLSVEVMSPSNTGPEIHAKIVYYFQAGAKLVWVRYPQSRVVCVYKTPTDITVLEKDDVLDGGTVLPGFSVKVADIFSILDQ